MNSYIKNFATVAQITSGISALENGQLFTCEATGFMYRKTSGTSYTRVVGREESAVHSIIQSGNTYSTTERALDEIAPNGKQVYTRSWTGTTAVPSDGTLLTIPTGLNLIEFKAYGWWTSGTTVKRFIQGGYANNTATQTYFWDIYYDAVTGIIRSGIQGPFVIKDWTVTIKYTK